MKELKTSVSGEYHWQVKIEAAKRKLTMKDFLIGAVDHIIDNKVPLAIK
jgi:hypothetical protein